MASIFNLVALGPEERTARLIDGEDFGSNRGGAHIDDEGDASSGAHNVQMKRLVRNITIATML